MDPTLYIKVYGEGVNKVTILGYTEYTKARHLPDLIINYVWRARPKVES